MGKGDSLTISILRQNERRAAALGAGLALLGLTLAACTIEVGPPPESDPPLVTEAEKRPPPPAQPSEPQPWSRDLDFEAGPTRIDRDVLADGLVASEGQGSYSRERLTYESAFNPDRPPSEAELARERAKARAEAAGLPPPPEVNAAPVASVNSESLPPAGEAAPQRRQSRLPAPPKFPPLPPKEPETAEAAEAAAPPAEPAVADAAPAPAGQRPSRLPPPPKFPPLPAETPIQEAAAPADEVPAPAETPVQEAAAPAAEAPAPAPAVAETAPPATVPETPAAGPVEDQAAAFLGEAWDAPEGTILVQVSAVQQKLKVPDEWARLQARYPQVLKPLRLVIDEAKLGDRGVFYRVQAGAFGTQAGATAACESLISQGQACFVVVR